LLDSPATPYKNSVARSSACLHVHSRVFSLLYLNTEAQDECPCARFGNEDQ
jgi:hypothetical protein